MAIVEKGDEECLDTEPEDVVFLFSVLVGFLFFLSPSPEL